ncbi:amino acid adenylation domain-containing protein [Acetitomaculum ruminis DSM 5522]|uniref:Amino acid adenylation domain-containing protein n=1 Tax=Acetitomaculum ruminis DSM 5522 TaxID=1120918 RepID=A0A1I0YU35_9FIRM|nr:amino acid adenylation domain-containing protein [Acetitomaculum ruminis]SFB16794.1 amino acid adenylation domain-containing protein [Acetitomaculum ruminis DSM 5522]
MKNILEGIEKSARLFPKNIAVSDVSSKLSYEMLIKNSKKIAVSFKENAWRKKPIAILMDKSVKLATSMLAVLYSGNFYTVLDPEMPKDRMLKIFETLEPVAVLTNDKYKDLALELGNTDIFYYENAINEEIDEEYLYNIRRAMTDSETMYILYTSGSTGNPKGTVISHKAAISYTDWVLENFDINEKTIWGSQTPFYFSMSVTDLFGGLRSGGCLCIIPKKMFSFPLKLVEYMNENKINTIYWVPSALSLVAKWDTFSYDKPMYLKKILFAGEVMPNKQLNYWRRAYPDAYFANLFGPTETTDICTWYHVDKEFKDEETLPIGKPCNNCFVLILDEDLKEADKGELYVGGSFLADGYYNNPEKTKASFVQNPLNKAYPEILYKTGDLVSYNEYGQLIYLGRKDFQIKHMGYRIELGEIEANMSAMEKMNSCACIYNETEDKIVLIYEGRIKKDAVMEHAKKKLPPYMHPNVLVKVKAMPVNANGKIDRVYLKNNYNLMED